MIPAKLRIEILIELHHTHIGIVMMKQLGKIEILNELHHTHIGIVKMKQLAKKLLLEGY